MQISQFFLNGDMKGALAYMRSHEAFKEILPAYTAIFEDCKYRTYEIPDMLNAVLRLYQVYFRDTFYCGSPEATAADKLLTGLKHLLNMPDADEDTLVEQLQSVFEENGYHALFGKTQGYYGPYVWRDTVPTVYRVELPDGAAEYTVNILKGFVFRSWLDYLTFGKQGTGGWASPDGTINCIEQAYDFESERFLVSLLKHEAQHTVDMKRFPGITPAELEYRAKLVELHYCSDLGLLQKFLSIADERKITDSHALACAQIKLAFAHTNQADLSCVQTNGTGVASRAHENNERKIHCTRCKSIIFVIYLCPCIVQTSNANICTYDLTAVHGRIFGSMQRFIAVECHGQISTDSPLGDFARIGCNTAWQIEGQHKCSRLMRAMYQRAGSASGRAQTAMESGAVQGIRHHPEVLQFQSCSITADGDLKALQACIICYGIGCFRLALRQQDRHLPTF